MAFFVKNLGRVLKDVRRSDLQLSYNGSSTDLNYFHVHDRKESGRNRFQITLEPLLRRRKTTDLKLSSIHVCNPYFFKPMTSSLPTSELRFPKSEILSNTRVPSCILCKCQCFFQAPLLGTPGKPADTHCECHGEPRVPVVGA